VKKWDKKPNLYVKGRKLCVHKLIVCPGQSRTANTGQTGTATVAQRHANSFSVSVSFCVFPLFPLFPVLLLMAFTIYDALKAVQDLWRPTTGANSQIIVAEQHFCLCLLAFLFTLL